VPDLVKTGYPGLDKTINKYVVLKQYYFADMIQPNEKHVE